MCGAHKSWKEDQSEQGGETGKVGGRDLILCKTLQVRRRILVFSFMSVGDLFKQGLENMIRFVLYVVVVWSWLGELSE